MCMHRDHSLVYYVFNPYHQGHNTYCTSYGCLVTFPRECNCGFFSHYSGAGKRAIDNSGKRTFDNSGKKNFDNSGMNPFMLAVDKGHWEVVKFMMKEEPGLVSLSIGSVAHWNLGKDHHVFYKVCLLRNISVYVKPGLAYVYSQLLPW